MNLNTLKKAPQATTSILAGLVLAVALPMSAFASEGFEAWKVNPAKSKINSAYATLALQPSGAAPGLSSGKVIVVSKGNVWLINAIDAYDGKSIRQVVFDRMNQGKAVLIGTNAHSTDICGFRCQSGFAEPRTITFKIVNSESSQVRDMLAANDPGVELPLR